MEAGASSSASSLEQKSPQDDWSQFNPDQLSATENSWRSEGASTEAVNKNGLSPEEEKIISKNLLGPMMVEMAKQQNPTKKFEM